MRIMILVLAALAMAPVLALHGSTPAVAQSSLLSVEYKISATQLNAGPVGLGSSVMMQLVVANLSSTDTLKVAGNMLDGTVGFSLQQGGTITIQPQDSAPLFIRFLPVMIGSANETLVLVVSSQGASIPLDTVEVSLTGFGEMVGVRLDTASAAAGDLVTLTMRGLVNPFQDTTTEVLLTLYFNPRALFLKEVRMLSAGELLAFEGTGDSSIRIRLPALTRTELIVQLTFRGLSTGQPENIVRIDSVLVSDEVLPIAGHGLVLLSGCDIEHELRLGRRVSALGVQHDPDEALLTLTYRAPTGSEPELRMYDINGDCCLTRILPAATDQEQTIQLPIPRLGRGFYLLELHDRTERAILPLMIAR